MSLFIPLFPKVSSTSELAISLYPNQNKLFANDALYKMLVLIKTFIGK